MLLTKLSNRNKNSMLKHDFFSGELSYFYLISCYSPFFLHYSPSVIFHSLFSHPHCHIILVQCTGWRQNLNWFNPFSTQPFIVFSFTLAVIFTRLSCGQSWRISHTLPCYRNFSMPRSSSHLCSTRGIEGISGLTSMCSVLRLPAQHLHHEVMVGANTLICI